MTPFTGLAWEKVSAHREATIGDFAGGDGIRFTLEHYPTCYRRGQWRLMVEVAEGEGHEKWGCFDDSDQPMRWYHSEAAALGEAHLIATVLCTDRAKRD